jgi:acyl-coenzyme A synthetase/AMP-(fatty) acid ligase
MQHLFDAVPHFRKIHAPTLGGILAEDPVPHYPYDMAFETAPNYDIVTLHTSGTSGNPKPIAWNTRWISKIDQGHHLPIHQGAPLFKTTLWHENAICLLPCFHVSPPLL